MNTPHQRRPTQLRRRRGATIIVVIAFYAVAMTLFSVWIHTSLGRMRQTRQQQEKRQAVWLADSGLRRAVTLLATDPDYTGEEWQLTAKELGGKHTAMIKIRVVAVKNTDGKKTDARQLRITATALFPADTEQKVRHTKSIRTSFPPLSPWGRNYRETLPSPSLSLQGRETFAIGSTSTHTTSTKTN